MSDSATAQAQAEHALDQAAKALKRNLATTRAALQEVRRAQAAVVGITVTTTHSPQGGHSERRADP